MDSQTSSLFPTVILEKGGMSHICSLRGTQIHERVAKKGEETTFLHQLDARHISTLLQAYSVEACKAVSTVL